MTILLDIAVDTVRSLPPDMQDDIASMVLSVAGAELPPVNLTADEDAALALSEAAANRGEFATDAEVYAIWAKHGL